MTRESAGTKGFEEALVTSTWFKEELVSTTFSGEWLPRDKIFPDGFIEAIDEIVQSICMFGYIFG